MRSIAFPRRLWLRSFSPSMPGAAACAPTRPHRWRTRHWLLAAACLMPLASHAQTGVVRIAGAITEPACKVQAAAVQRADSQKRPAGAHTLQLELNCHTDQSVQVAFERPGHATRAGATAYQEAINKPQAAGALSTLSEGEMIPLALKGRQQSQFSFNLAAPPGTEQLALDQHADHVLVSLTYR